MRSLRRWAGYLARSPLGKAIPAALYAVGLTEWSQWCSRYTRFVPPIVRVMCPNGRSFLMHSRDGRDNVVFEVWCGGYYHYEAPLPAILAALAPGAGTVIGVGANSGFYDLAAATLSDKAQVYAFEPFPEAYQALCDNIRLNQLEGRVHAVDKAVADREDTMNLFVPAKTHGTILETSSSLNPHFREAHSEVLRVPVTTLDRYAADRGLAPIDVIRIDVESMEHLVLHGAARILQESQPYLVLEVLESADVEMLNVLCAQAGYLPYLLSEQAIVAQETVRWRPGSENQLFCPLSRKAELLGRMKEIGFAVR